MEEEISKDLNNCNNTVTLSQPSAEDFKEIKKQILQGINQLSYLLTQVNNKLLNIKAKLPESSDNVRCLRLIYRHVKELLCALFNNFSVFQSELEQQDKQWFDKYRVKLSDTMIIVSREDNGGVNYNVLSTLSSSSTNNTTDNICKDSTGDVENEETTPKNDDCLKDPKTNEEPDNSVNSVETVAMDVDDYREDVLTNTKEQDIEQGTSNNLTATDQDKIEDENMQENNLIDIEDEIEADSSLMSKNVTLSKTELKDLIEEVFEDMINKKKCKLKSETKPESILNAVNLIIKAEIVDLTLPVEESNDNDLSVNELLDLLGKVEDDDILFSSDMDGSTGDSSSEEEEVIIPKKSKKVVEEPVGFTIHKLPALPSDDADSDETKVNSVDWEENINAKHLEEHKIQQCYVRLERLATTDYNLIKEQEDLKAINRLLNIDDIERKRTASSSYKRRTKKRRLTKRKAVKIGSNSSDEDFTDSNSNSVISQKLENSFPTTIPSISNEDHGYILLMNNMYDSSEISSELSDSDSDNSKKEEPKISKPRKKIPKRKESSSESLENEPKENELRKRSHLWNDPLLRMKLTESESDSKSDNDVVGDSVISEKTKNKLLQEPIPEPKRANVLKKQKVATEISTNNISSSSSEENEKVASEGIIVNSSSDTDVEVVPLEQDTLQLTSTSNTSLNSKGKGRRNIRRIISTNVLDKRTRQANLLEKEKKERLSQKHKKRLNLDLTNKSDRGLILDFDVETNKPLICVHPAITKKLKDHQKEGVRFMWDNCYESIKDLNKTEGVGCILAHCMGLGKTLQAVALVHTVFVNSATNTKHILIVCPLSLVLNWYDEFKKGLQKVDISTRPSIFYISDCSTNQRKRLEVEKWRNKTGVLIMGYEAYRSLTKPSEGVQTLRQINLEKALVNPGPDLVILDEGHLLKNGKISRTRALMKIKTKRRIILTGTPLQNNLKEYYYMVQFVKPSLLGSFREYTNRFVNPITNGQYDDSTEVDIVRMKQRSHVLHNLLGGTVQRYEVTELQKYLPKRHDYVLFIKLHPFQANLYKYYISLLSSGTNTSVKGGMLDNYHKLMYIWTHPYLLYLKNEQKNQKKPQKEVDTINLYPEINENDEDLPEFWWHALCPGDFKTNIDYSPKFKVMFSIIEQCQKRQDKLIIFSNSLLELDAIEYFLKLRATKTQSWDKNLDYYRMDGRIQPEHRLKLCNDFSSNKRVKILLISHRVGGLGLNLVAANRIILMDVNWNPSYDLQSIFRIYRFGQLKECYIYRLVSLGTMEEVVYERQITKLAVAGRVIDDLQISRHYKSGDLSDIYRRDFKLDIERPTLQLPSDYLLAKVVEDHKDIFKYHEHQSLLENLPGEGLNDDEIKLAWEEFRKEQDARELSLSQSQGEGSENKEQSVSTNTSNVAVKTAVNAKTASCTKPCDPSTSAQMTSVQPKIVSRPLVETIFIQDKKRQPRNRVQRIPMPLNGPQSTGAAVIPTNTPVRNSIPLRNLTYLNSNSTIIPSAPLSSATSIFPNPPQTTKKPDEAVAVIDLDAYDRLKESAFAIRKQLQTLRSVQEKESITLSPLLRQHQEQEKGVNSTTKSAKDIIEID